MEESLSKCKASEADGARGPSLFHGLRNSSEMFGNGPVHPHWSVNSDTPRMITSTLLTISLLIKASEEGEGHTHNKDLRNPQRVASHLVPQVGGDLEGTATLSSPLTQPEWKSRL